LDLRKGAKEEIDGHPYPVALDRLGQMQFIFFNEEKLIRRNRVNGVGSDLDPIFGLSYRHRGIFGEQPGHVAHMT
jgi:hypothetical protein